MEPWLNGIWPLYCTLRSENGIRRIISRIGLVRPGLCAVHGDSSSGISSMINLSKQVKRDEHTPLALCTDDDELRQRGTDNGAGAGDRAKPRTFLLIYGRMARSAVADDRLMTPRGIKVFQSPRHCSFSGPSRGIKGY